MSDTQRRLLTLVLAPLAGWWRAADERSGAAVGWLIVDSIGVWAVVVLLLDLDRFDTLSTATALSVAIKGLIAVAAGLLAARGYFGPQKVVLARFPNWLALRNRTADWVLRGCVTTAVTTAAFWWFADQLVGITAQHIAGSMAIYHGRVTSADRPYITRAKCKASITVRLLPGLDAMEFCLKISGGHAIGPLELAPPDPVVIRTRRTALGEVVDSVEYDDQPQER